MTKEEIQRNLLEGERMTLECKQAGNSLPKSVWETYSAFANTVGGMILLGITEHKGEKDLSKRYTVTGVDNARKMVEDFWNTINNRKVSANILFDRDVQIVDVDGKSVVCITVPQAKWSEKPVYLNENIFKGSYKRNHDGDYHCSEREVRTMIRDANENGNDGALLEDFTMADIDPETLSGYRNIFRIANPDHPWNDITDKDFVMNFGGYARDRKSGQEGLTVAGLMMFGKGLAIRERFANFRMDYLDMSHLIGDQRYRDRLTYDGRWENNFYQFFRIVMPKLTFDMPRPFQMDGIQRIDDTIQIKAVREAFTNAIIHCDLFAASGILRIEKHDDRLSLRNPGLLLLPIERVYAGGNSKARNPRIQNMFRMIGYGENVGSGFPKIIRAWEQVGWKEPMLENKIDLDEVELTLFVPFDEYVEQKQEDESNQESLKSNQEKVKSNQESLKRNQESNQERTKSNQEKAKSNQESNQERPKSNQERPKSNQEKVKSNQESLKSNQELELTEEQVGICEFCTEPRSAKEIMERLGLSNQSKNRQKYIGVLVEKGALALTIPDKPKDRNQKYKKTPRTYVTIRREKKKNK